MGNERFGRKILSLIGFHIIFVRLFPIRMLHINQIVSACNGQWILKSEDSAIEQLYIDTRKLRLTEKAMFVAISTARRNGHDFIPDAYNKGVRNFLVAQPVDENLVPGANVILVKDTVAALQAIARVVREQYDIPVIGITGSNGKTIVKEWLAQLLAQSFRIVKTPKSYNSQIGAPLSVWQMNAVHTLGIFEAGISQPGEMERLEKIIHPTIGVMTNIGEAHNEGFINMRQKINEKLVLFRRAQTLVYCRDYHELHECVVQYFNHVKGVSDKPLQLFSWSYRNNAELLIRRTNKLHGKTEILAEYQGREIGIMIPFTDTASIENAINCWCVLLLMGISDRSISERMAELKPIAMRLELRHGNNNTSIINDSYNSDITSLHVALDFLDQQKQHVSKTVILSDIFQTGRPDSELYSEVAGILAQRNISRFIGIGPVLYKYRAAFREHKKVRSFFFKSTDEFLKKMHLLSFENESILLKGSRSFAFEKINLLLEQKIHQTVMSIDLSALRHNIEVIRGRTAAGVKLMAMVKAFSYGSGSYEIANELQAAGVNYLAVAYPDEGIALRKAGITMPIMVMSPSAIAFDRMIAWKLEPEIFNLRSLMQFSEMASNLDVTGYPIHIKLDTGMHRLGFEQGELEGLISFLRKSNHLKVASVFSHLAASEDESLTAFTKQQGKRFTEMSQAVTEALSYKPLRHLCNSAGIVLHPDLHFDMVRMGLSLYGIDSSNKLEGQLQPIATLKTTIAQIKHVPEGETVGYSRKGIAERDMRIATICIGYADGYPRSMSNGVAYVLVNNKPAKIVGIIAMDMCMVDITDIDGVNEGDEVVVFGPQLSLNQLAKWAGTIPYEIMTGISQRVKRVYTNEH